MKNCLLFFVFTSFLISCLQNSNTPKNTKPTSKNKPPTVIKAEKPVGKSIGKSIASLAKPSVQLPAGFNIHMPNYNTEQGLALSQVLCGYKDKLGNLWFGTNGGGASRYDGKSFTSFTTTQGLVNDVVRDITEDRSGNLWFSTSGGVSRYNGKSFTNFTVAQGLGNDVALCIIEDKAGSIWIGTYGSGVSRFDPSKEKAGKNCFTNFTNAQGLINNLVNSIHEDKKGNLWIGTNNGISRYDGVTFSNFTTKEGLVNNSVYDIIEDNAGNFWFGTEGGISRYDGTAFSNFTAADGLANNSVASIAQDKKGNLWFGTNGGGISRYDGKKFTNYTTTEGLSNNVVLSITEDNARNLWFGTFGGGVSRYEGEAFSNITNKRALSAVWSIVEDKSRSLWIGTNGSGVLHYDGESFFNFTMKEGLPDNTIWSILEDKEGNIWFGFYAGGVSRYDGKTFTNFSSANHLPPYPVKSIAQDNEKNIWFGTNGGGVSRYDGKSFSTFTTAHGLVNNLIKDIIVDKAGVLWFATADGVSRYDGQKFTNYTTSQGLLSNFILSIAEDEEGNLWFGTAGGGVSRYDGNTFTNYTTTQGLANDVVYAVSLDKEGNIIIATNLGFTVLKRFEKNELYEKNKTKYTSQSLPPSNKLSAAELSDFNPIFEHYNQKTGYPIKDINEKAMLCDSKGIIWAGTGDNKLIRFDYKAVRKNLEPPIIVIQNIKINNENIIWHNLFDEKNNGKAQTKIANNFSESSKINEEVLLYGKSLTEAQRDTMRKKFRHIQFDDILPFYPIPTNLVLPYENNNITFNFTAIEPAKPTLVKYQCFLEGYDNDWSPVTSKTSVDYGNIAEGVHTFKLKALSPDGVWSKPLTYTFEVLPPWHRTWWAYSLAFILLILIIVSIFNIRTAALRRDKLLLEQTVNERTLEIELQKQIIEKKNENITDSINYAKYIQDSILKSEEEIQKHLPQLFIYFRPKDIVSGDFYWFSQQGTKSIIAVADCTGHGVPGAFMSMIGIMLLNEIINSGSITDPSTILMELHKGINKSLQQHNSEERAQDGMDISICVIDKTKNIIEFAGAKNPLYIVKNDILEVVKADIYSIGGGFQFLKNRTIRFTNHLIQIEEGMSIYMSTDGYMDQFGGIKRIKFGSVQFKKVLIEGARLTACEQKKIIHKRFEDWKNNSPQIDDALVLGIKLT